MDNGWIPVMPRFRERACSAARTADWNHTWANVNLPRVSLNGAADCSAGTTRKTRPGPPPSCPRCFTKTKGCFGR